MFEKDGPLAGVRVLSFGSFIAGSTVAVLLAELGAEVAKIEPFDRPEVVRTPAFILGPPVVEPSGAPNTIMYGTQVRGVRSLSIDLTKTEARPIFHQLARQADVIIENFAGSTLARWSCGYEDLLVENPRLVWLSMSGYGRTGPRAGYLAYAGNICGYSGLSSAWGYSHGSHSDFITAATSAVAILAGLAQVAKTEGSVYLDVAQIDAMASLLAPVLLDPLVNGREYEPHQNTVPGSWFSGVYQCLGQDAWVAIDLPNRDDWAALCRFLGRDDLEAQTLDEAASHRNELEAAFLVWLVERTSHSAAHLLQKAGIPAVPVQDSEDVWRDPQLRSREFLIPLDQPDYGEVHYPQSTFRLSRTPGRLRFSGPRLGEHTYETLRDWLGLPDSQLDWLESTGAIFQAP